MCPHTFGFSLLYGFLVIFDGVFESKIMIIPVCIVIHAVNPFPVGNTKGFTDSIELGLVTLVERGLVDCDFLFDNVKPEQLYSAAAVVEHL